MHVENEEHDVYTAASDDTEEIYIQYLKNALIAIEQNDLPHALCHCALAWWSKNNKTIEELNNIESKYCGKLPEYKEVNQ